MRLLIDEQLSPILVRRSAEKGIFAQHVAHVGLSGKSDHAIWLYAYRNDQIVVTANAGDFLMLAAGVDLHPGLVVLRESGLDRREQWSRLEPVIDHLLEMQESIINRVIEISGPGRFTFRSMLVIATPKKAWI